MRLNKIEKIIVAVLLLGVILVGGAFIFVVPTFDKMDKANQQLEKNKTEKANLEADLARLASIDTEITETKNNAEKFEGGFYPDLTTYETSEIAMALMKKCNLQAHTISITDISTYDLMLEHYIPVEVEYTLKTYSQTAKNAGTDAESEELLQGQFKDGGKLYTVTVPTLATPFITNEEGETVEPSRYSPTMEKVLKAAVCEYAQAGKVKHTVACTKATYEVTGKNSDYIKFIDYIYSLPRATSIDTVTIPMTIEIKDDKDDEEPTYYISESGAITTGKDAAKKNQQMIVADDTEVTETVALTFYSVEPMHSIKDVDAGGTKVAVDLRPAVY